MKSFMLISFVVVITSAVKEGPNDENLTLTPVSAASSTLDVRVRDDDGDSDGAEADQPMDSTGTTGSTACPEPAVEAASSTRALSQAGLTRLADGTVDFHPEYQRSRQEFQRMQEDMETLTNRYTRLTVAFNEVQERADERHHAVMGYKSKQQECDRLHADLTQCRSELGRSQQIVARQTASLAQAANENEILRRNPRQVEQSTTATQTETSIFSTRHQIDLNGTQAFYRRTEHAPSANAYGHLTVNAPEVRRHRFGDAPETPADTPDPTLAAAASETSRVLHAAFNTPRNRERRRPSPHAAYRFTASRLSRNPSRNYNRNDRPRHRNTRSRSPTMKLISAFDLRKRVAPIFCALARAISRMGQGSKFDQISNILAQHQTKDPPYSTNERRGHDANNNQHHLRAHHGGKINGISQPNPRRVINEFARQHSELIALRERLRSQDEQNASLRQTVRRLRSLRDTPRRKARNGRQRKVQHPAVKSEQRSGSITKIGAKQQKKRPAASRTSPETLPTWRIIDFPPPGGRRLRRQSEQTDDESYAKRHAKHERHERLIVRRDLMRQRALAERERLLNSKRTSILNQTSCKSNSQKSGEIGPSVSDIEQIMIVNRIPVGCKEYCFDGGELVV